MTLTRTTSTLPDELEHLITRVIGCCIDVHCAIGPGFHEGAYRRACSIELAFQRIAFETEKSVTVWYRDQVVCRQRIDLVVAGELVLELKSVDRIHPVHVAQAISYLRATGLRAALVINFNVPALSLGIKRVVL
jgi:GxxExxY protein